MIRCVCGSDSDFRKLLVLVPALVSVPDPDTGFPKKNCTNSCLFNVRSSLFPKKLCSHFLFDVFYLHFMLDPEPNLVHEPDPDPKP
jgi:hypothetical protein